MALDVAKDTALSGGHAAQAAKDAIAAHFRGLWAHQRLRDDIESISTIFASQGFWRDGWLAVRLTRVFDEKDKSSNNYARLSALEELLKPRDLVQSVRGRVLSSNGVIADVDDVDLSDAQSFRVALENRNEEAEALGIQVAHDRGALQELMPKIMTGHGYLFHFGRGLAEGSSDPKQLWQELVQRLERGTPESKSVSTLRGMLSWLDTNKTDLADELLDQALTTGELALYFPSLQASVAITPRGMARLIASLELVTVPTYAYGEIFLGRAIEAVSGADIAKYILKVAQAPRGVRGAIRILGMQFFADRGDKRPHASELVEAGRKLLRDVDFDGLGAQEDHLLQIVVEVCIDGNGGYAVARATCESLRQAVGTRETHGSDHRYLIKGLFQNTA